MPGLGQRNRRRGRRRGGLGEAKVAGGGSQSAASARGGAAPGAGAAGKGKPAFNPYKTLAELSAKRVLSPKQLREGARALTGLQTRAEVGAYRRTAGELHKERESEAKALGKLGGSLQGGVSDAYRAVAASEAQSLATQQALAGGLNQASADIARQGMADLSAMQNIQTGGVESSLAARGAPGGGAAQAELAAAVAAQKASQSAGSQASQQFAAQQGAGYGQLANMMGRATQMQGGAAVGGIGQTVIGRIGKSNREYGSDIREARAKEGEARANKGLLYAKNLLELRGQEQEFGLGKMAVTSEREKQKLAEKENAQDQAQRKAENAQWAKEFGLAKYEARHPNAGSDEIAEKRKEIKEDVGEIKSVIPTAVASAKRSGEQVGLEAYISYVNTKTSAPPQLVRKVVTKWYKNAKTEGNRGVPGVPQTPYK